MPKITITIPANTSKPTQIDVEGVQGSGCQDLTKNIEAALGSTDHTELKDEFYNAPIDQDLDNTLGVQF